MNITPALINPHALAAAPDRSVAPVRSTGPTRDALADAEQRHPTVESFGAIDRERLEQRAHTLVQPLDPRLPKHAQRALTSYAAVSAQPDRADLQTMLGFDDFA